jgi:NAD+ synthetase
VVLDYARKSAMSPAKERPPLRVGLAQFKPRKADVAGNLQRARDWIMDAAAGNDLLVFPEASLSGYFLEGGVFEAALTADELCEGLGAPPERAPDLALGFYERRRNHLFNSIAYLTPSGDTFQPLHIHRKMFLPTYGVFDEDRFVEAGQTVEAFDTRFGRMGMLICEDMWHCLPSAILALDGAELLVVASASPAREFLPQSGQPGNLDRWDKLAPGAALEHGIFVVVSQLVGSEGGKIFPGGSIAVGPDGRICARAPLFEEGVTTVALEGADVSRARFDSPLLADLRRMLPDLQAALERTRRSREERTAGFESPTPGVLLGREAGASQVPGPRPDDDSPLRLDLELVRRALVEFIREEVSRRRRFERVVVGVSGGVDSAVSLCLAVEALGPDNVFGFRLPYATSSPDSLEHGALVIQATGAQQRTIDITGPVDAYIEECEPDISPIRRGNVAARFRALTLFDQSAKLRALPLGTGNKSERLFGYFTWHADDSPPINPLGDLFKCQVWALARHLGVPEEIVEKPASADLIRGIRDEDELGISYPKADLILYWFLRGYHPEELVRQGFPEIEVDLVWRRLNATHWKRELPTVAMLSSSAIGEFYLRPVDY